MKVIKTLFQQIWTKGALGIAVCSLAFCLSGFVSEAAEGTITAETARIRAAADANSEVIGSTTRGKVIDILEAVQDSSGTVWYKVPNGNNTYGYIRSDLVSTSDTIEITANSSSGGGNSTGNSNTLAATVPTSIGEMQATISQGSVRIRSGASTQHDTVISLPQGTTITLIGEANDSAGNKWYQMTCNYNGRAVEGYVRSDLITIGGNADGGEGSEGNPENTEGANPEETNSEGGTEPQESVEPTYDDYEIVYDSGEGVYWLYNNTDSSNRTMVRVEDLLNVAEVANTNMEAFQRKIQNERIVIIILAVIIVVLVIVVTVLLFKIRDLYYTAYEDYDEEEEEEEEEEEPITVRKKKRRTMIEEDVEEEPVPAKKRRSSSQSGDTGKEKSTRRQIREENAELQAAERKPSTQRTSQRKPQNFLLDDDEFEFEFLNMDDKDL